jgi:hypothetical protein
MKLFIKRPSEYIRYTDNEISELEKECNERFANNCKDNPEFRAQVLEDAKAEWNEVFVK